MKAILVNFVGKVGVLRDGRVVELDVTSMREYFERGGAPESGDDHALEDVKLRAPIRNGDR